MLKSEGKTPVLQNKHGNFTKQKRTPQSTALYVHQASVELKRIT